MSTDTGQLLILGAVGASALANAITAVLICRHARRSDVVAVPGTVLLPREASFYGDAAGCRSAAMGGAPAPNLTCEFGPSNDGHRGARLHAQWQGRSLEVVVCDDGALRLEVAATKGDLSEGKGKVRLVGDLDPAEILAAGRQQTNEPDAKTNGVAADHPVGVDHAKHRTDNGDPESHPADPVHAAEHSAGNQA